MIFNRTFWNIVLKYMCVCVCTYIYAQCFPYHQYNPYSYLLSNEAQREVAYIRPLSWKAANNYLEYLVVTHAASMAAPCSSTMRACRSGQSCVKSLRVERLSSWNVTHESCLAWVAHHSASLSRQAYPWRRSTSPGSSVLFWTVHPWPHASHVLSQNRSLVSLCWCLCVSCIITQYKFSDFYVIGVKRKTLREDWQRISLHSVQKFAEYIYVKQTAQA